MNVMSLIYVSLGGAFGALMRYALTDLIARFNNSYFPVGTLAVNVVGCFLIGIWIATATLLPPAKIKDLHLLLAVGALGGFTTFSAFALDVFLLGERELYMAMAFYISASVILSLAALLLGIFMIRMVVA